MQSEKKEQRLKLGANASDKCREAKKILFKGDGKVWSEMKAKGERMEPNKEDFANEGVTKSVRHSSEIQEGTVHFIW